MTETTSQAATAPPDLVRRKPGTVGPPLDGVEVRIEPVADEPDGRDGHDSQDAPDGQDGSSGRDGPKARVGELHVRGPVLAAGVLGSGEPLVGADGWFATGDLGELDDDGHLRITGRRSDRIITGGVNVDPAEVEAVLLGHPQVADGAVVGLPDPVWGERVTAAVVAASGSEPEGGAVRAWLRERLAGAKVPKEVAVVTFLPRNPNGKVDRAALRAQLEASGPDSFRRGRPGHT